VPRSLRAKYVRQAWKVDYHGESERCAQQARVLASIVGAIPPAGPGICNVNVVHLFLGPHARLDASSPNQHHSAFYRAYLSSESTLRGVPRKEHHRSFLRRPITRPEWGTVARSGTTTAAGINPASPPTFLAGI
jgi:hypothetical protein